MPTVTDEGWVLGGRYRIGAKLGQGAMAEVFDAVDTRLDRSVAVKVLRGAAALGPDGRARFEQEARAAARLSHPHSVAVYDSGTDGDVAYIVMERLPGTTLADYLQGGPLAADWVVQIATDVLDALGAAHAAGLTHRDVKPGNILITPDDRAKVADFGIAKLTEDDHDLTATGLVIGTAAYLPPERIDGRPASPRGDLYSLGVVLYEALAGRKPFTGDSPVAVAYAARHTRAAELRALRPDLPGPLAAAVERAMAPDPADRFASAAEMAAALRDGAAAPPEAAATAALPGALAAGAVGLHAPTEVLPPGGHPDGAPGDPTRRRRLLAALGVAAVLAAIALIVALASSRGPHRAGATAPTTAAPTTAAPTTTPPTTTPPSTAPPTTAAPDPQAAALERAAAALAASGGGGPEAAAILQQVAALPPALRPAAVPTAEATLTSLHNAGSITDAQYQQALAPLQAISGTPPPSTAPPGDGGHHDHGGKGG